MIHNFESPFVAWYPVKNHQEIKRKYLPIIHQHRDEIKDKPDCYADNSHTSYGFTNSSDGTNPLMQPDLIQSIIWDPYAYMLQEKQLSIQPEKSYLQDIWWNYYYPHGFARPHKHYESDFSGVYILKLDGLNNTQFGLTSDDMPNALIREKFSTNHIPEGNVMIFPSRLLHYTTPASKNRVVIVWNVECNWSKYH
jgi:hypothetical protein